MNARLASFLDLTANVVICLGCGAFIGLGMVLMHIVPSPPPIAGVMIGMGLGLLYPVVSGDGFWPKSAKREQQTIKRQSGDGAMT